LRDKRREIRGAWRRGGTFMRERHAVSQGETVGTAVKLSKGVFQLCC
jgi:hypothetical protein